MKAIEFNNDVVCSISKLMDVSSIDENDLDLYFIAKFVHKHFNGRKIVTWVKSEIFEEILQKYFNLSVCSCVSRDKKKLLNNEINPLSMIKDKSSEYYLVILDMPWSLSVAEKLKLWGFSENKDYVFRRIKPIVLKNISTEYNDDYGNSVRIKGGTIGKVVFRGFFNNINIGDGVKNTTNLSLDLCANSDIYIGDGVKIGKNFNISSTKYKKLILKIGKNVSFGANCTFTLLPPSIVVIGDNSTFRYGLIVKATIGKNIIIGKDCMCSYNVTLYSGDGGHTIFSCDTEEVINNYGEQYTPKDYLIVGNHVWLGCETFLLNGCNIGNGSIVGAKTVAKLQVPNNSIICGNPAKVVKHNIAWSRKNLLEKIDIRDCGLDNAKKTCNLVHSMYGRNILLLGHQNAIFNEFVNHLANLGNKVFIDSRCDVDSSLFLVNALDVNSISDESSINKYDFIFIILDNGITEYKNIFKNIHADKFICCKTFNHSMMIDDFDYIDASVRNYLGINSDSFIFVNFPFLFEKTTLLSLIQAYIKNNNINVPIQFVRMPEVCSFLTMIACQDIRGIINYSCEGEIFLNNIYSYISEKNIKIRKNDSICDIHFNNQLYLDIDEIKKLGFEPSKLDDWFWDNLDNCIK